MAVCRDHDEGLGGGGAGVNDLGMAGELENFPPGGSAVDGGSPSDAPANGGPSNGGSANGAPANGGSANGGSLGGAQPEGSPNSPRGGPIDGGGLPSQDNWSMTRRTGASRTGASRTGASRIGTRNEVPSRHVPSAGPRSATTRTAPPARGLPPAQSGERDSAALGARPTLPIPAAREETVELAAYTNAGPVVPVVRNPATAPAVGGENAGPATDAGPAEPVAPSRPAPDDAAAEVWALVERAQAGDSAAFGLIYDRYLDTVFRFIYFRVGNRPLAEDLTADTFLRALKRIGSFTWQGRDLGAWLVTIARNLVADHFKSGRYRLEVSTGEVLDADQADRGPEGSPEAAVVDHITNVALLAAVKQLNPEQQECIVLRFLHGFSVAETAHAMGKNEGAIKALQYRAVRALHRLLPEGFQP